MDFFKNLFKSKKAIVITACSLVLVIALLATYLLGGFTADKEDPVGKPYAREKVWDPVFDDELKGSFNFFWDNANSDKNSKGYGLMVDRVSNKNMASIASVGFALTAYGIGVENKFITKEQGAERAIGTMKTLLNNAANVHGIFYHFVDMKTGVNSPGSEVSIIDTALCMNGVLFAGEYFGGEAKELADKLYKRTEWNWYVNKDTNQFYMGYNKENGFSGSWGKYAEQLQMYFLGAASPTYPINDKAFYDFKRETTSQYGYPMYVQCTNGNPLFTYQFSHAFFDLNNTQDKNFQDWYYNSVLATLANRQFCIDNSNIVKTYGFDAWGLTPSDVPTGYGIYGASVKHQIDGTVPVCGPLGSAPFTPQLVKEAATQFKTHDKLWDDKYGFYDSYNLSVGDPWYCRDMLGIDKGVSIVMLENLRSGLVWEYMNKNEYVEAGMKKCGITNAASYMVDDADGNKFGSGFESGVTPNKVASKGSNSFETNFAAPLKSTFNVAAPDALNMEILRMDVKGKGSFKVKLTDASGATVKETSAKEVNSVDGFKTVDFDLKDVADEKIINVKNIEISGTNITDKVLLDEVQFSTASDIVRNVTIDEQAFAGQTVGAIFDYYSPFDHKEPKFRYQWLSGDAAEGEFKKISKATAPEYKVTKDDVGKFLRVEVTPVTDDNKPISGTVLSTPSARVTPDKPKDVKFIQKTLSEMVNVVPDSFSGDTFNIANKWKDGPDAVYQIEYAEDGNSFDTAFDKGPTDWSFMYRDIMIQDISKANRLDITASGDCTLIMKIESKTKDPAEIKLFLGSEGSYQWDLTDIKPLLSDVSKILIFAAPGQTKAQGNFSIRKLEFNVAKASGNNVIKTNGSNAPVNFYNGKDETFNVNKLWQDFGDGVYTINETTEKTDVKYNKPAKTTWAMMFSNIDGDLSSFKKVVFEIKGEKGKQILAKVEGKEKNKLSQVMLFADPGVGGKSGEFTIDKAYFSKEAYVGSEGGQNALKYNGGGADFDLNRGWASQDAGHYSISGRTNFVYKLPKSVQKTRKVEATTVAPTSAAESGIFTFSGGVDKIEIDLSAVFAAKAATTTTAKAGTTETYWDPDAQYSFAYTNVYGKFSDFKFASFQIQGPAGKQAVIKLNYGSEWFEGYELKVSFNGQVQNVAIDLKNAKNLKGELISAATANRINKIMLLAEPGSKEARNGTIKLLSAKFTNSGDSVPINVYKGDKKDFNFNNYWQGATANYKPVKNGSTTTISYTTPSENQFSHFAYAPIKGNFSDFNYIVLKVKGAKNKQAIFKVEYSQWDKADYECAPNPKIVSDVQTFKGVEQDIVIDISKMSAKARNSLTQVLMFAEPDVKNASGSVDILSAYFTNTIPGSAIRQKNVYGNYPYDFDINKYWDDASGGNTYSVSKSGSNTIIDFDIPNASEKQYPSANTLIDGKGRLNSQRYFQFDVKGPKGKTALLKISFGKEWYQGLEKNIEFDGTVQKFVIDLKTYNTIAFAEVAGTGKPMTASQINKIDQVMLIASPGTKIASKGQMVISNARFTNHTKVEPRKVNELKDASKDFNFNNYWEDVGVANGGLPSQAVYKVSKSGTSTVVNFNIPASKSAQYPALNTLIDGKGNLSKKRYLQITVQGTKGKEIMVKMPVGSKKGTVIVPWYMGLEHKEVLTGAPQTLVIDLQKAMTPDASKDAKGNPTGLPAARVLTASEINNISEIQLFASPGTENASSGKFTILKAVFTNTEVEGNVNKYKGDKKDFSFNTKWNSGNLNHVKITPLTVGNKFNFTFDKFDWGYSAYSNVEGNLSDFQYIALKFKGDKDKWIKVKAVYGSEWFEGYEFNIKLTGVTQEFAIDFNNAKTTNGKGQPVTAANLNKISQIVIWETKNDKFDPTEIANINTTLTLEQARFTNVPPVIPEPPAVEVNDATYDILWNPSDAIGMLDWSGNTVTKTFGTIDGKVLPAYQNTGAGELFFGVGTWGTVDAGTDLSKYDYFIVQSSGASTCGGLRFESVGIDMWGAANEELSPVKSFSGQNINTAVYDLSPFTTKGKLDILKKIKYIHVWQSAATDSKVYHAYFAKKSTPVATTASTELNFINSWSDNGEGVYGLTFDDKSVAKVSALKPAALQKNLKAQISGATSQYTYLNVKVNVPAGRKFSIGMYETVACTKGGLKQFTGTGAEQSISIMVPKDFTVGTIAFEIEPSNLSDCAVDFDIIESFFSATAITTVTQ